MKRRVGIGEMVQIAGFVEDMPKLQQAAGQPYRAAAFAAATPQRKTLTALEPLEDDVFLEVFQCSYWRGRFCSVY